MMAIKADKDSKQLLIVRLFKFLQRQSKNPSAPEQIIRRLVDYMPSYYKDNQLFKDCQDFLTSREWGLALESLVELAAENGHYFYDEYWIDLSSAADQMKMTKQAEYCRKQLDRNSKEISFKALFGQTIVKIDETHYQHHISEKVKEEWADQRRAEDKILTLIEKDGIHYKPRGRSGFIYWVNNHRLTEVEYELGQKGLIMYLSKVDCWILPTKTKMTDNEKNLFKQQLNNWAESTNNALDLS